MKKYKRGYTQGVYDMFHIGHLNLLNHAKEQCEFLIVGINSDDLVWEYKHKYPVISEEERSCIVANIKAVDEVVIAHSLDKKMQLDQIGFDVIFIGDDWRGDPRWEETKKELAKYGVDVIFLSHTNGISSTKLRRVRNDRIHEDKVEECND